MNQNSVNFHSGKNFGNRVKPETGLTCLETECINACQLSRYIMYIISNPYFHSGGLIIFIRKMKVLRLALIDIKKLIQTFRNSLSGDLTSDFSELHVSVFF